MSAVAGVILAGGRSSRMGGGDKCLLPLGESRLIDHVLGRLSVQLRPIALSANGAPQRFADLGLPILPDALPDYPGPLAGVLAGMRWAVRLGASHVVTVAADTPFLPDDLAIRLAEASQGGTHVAIAACNEDGRLRPQPTIGLWPVALAGSLEDALQAGTRKIMAFVHDQPHVLVEFPDAAAFFNVNTPEDLEIAAARLGPAG